MLGLPQLNTADFPRELLYILATRPEVNRQFRAAITEVMAMNQIADRVVTAEPSASSPSVVADEILTYFREGCDVAVHSGMSLAELREHQERFAVAYSDVETAAYGGHGYTVTPLSVHSEAEAASGAGKALADAVSGDRATVMATQLLAAFKAKDCKSLLAIHHMGNNSPECVVMGLRVYQELIRQAAAQSDELFSSIVEHIVFVNSSAGGKGTSANKLDGFVIPKITDLVTVGLNADGSLKVPQTIEIPRDDHNTLQQFGNPAMLRVEVAADGRAKLHCITEDGTFVFKEAIPAYMTGDGLFFGETEAEVNEASVCRGLVSALEKLKPYLTEAQYATVAAKTKSDGTGYTLLCENASFNTGANCVEAAQLLLARMGKAALANAIVLHVQKGEQGIRAATTAFKQFCVSVGGDIVAPHVTAYLNPDFSPAVDYLSDEQFIIFAFNLLTEILVEQKYAMESDFHHPMMRAPALFAIAMDLVREIGFACGEKPTAADGTDLTVVQAHDLFKQKLWPALEAGLIPREGSHAHIRLRNAMLPWMKQLLSKAPASASASAGEAPLCSDAVLAKKLSAVATTWCEMAAADLGPAEGVTHGEATV